MDGGPGSGGVSRGRGDAPMTWGDETQGRSEDFSAKALEPARVLDAESTGVLGIGATAPTVDAQGESGGAATAGASTGEGAWRRRLAPHHREAVKQFFSGPKHD
ncbi:MAG: hypothetical protein ABIP42_03035 [Planctomycetota bacterium]